MHSSSNSCERCIGWLYICFTWERCNMSSTSTRSTKVESTQKKDWLSRLCNSDWKAKVPKVPWKKSQTEFSSFFRVFLVEDFDRKENSPGNEATFRGIGQTRSLLGAIGAKNRRAYSYRANYALENRQCVIGAIGAVKIWKFNFSLIAPIAPITHWQNFSVYNGLDRLC